MYGNMNITDGNGNNLTIYGTYSADGSTRYDAMSVKPVAGDTVTIYGVVGQFNGNSQIKNGWLMEHIPGSETPDEPGTETLVTEPEVGTAYKFGMNQVTLGDVYFFTGKMSGKYMGTTTNAAEAVDVYLEKVVSETVEYYLYFMDGDVKTYITMEAYKPADKNYYNADVVLTTDVPSLTYTWDETLQTIVCNTGDGGNFCFGTHGTYNTISCTAEYYYGGNNAANVDQTQFIARFYTVDESETPDNPDTPITPDEPENPTATGLKNGDRVVIFAPAYNKALSADKVTEGSYYNKGVDITVDGGKVSGYGDAEIWTVTVNNDGTYYFANGGQKLSLNNQHTSLQLDAENDKWELISLGGALFNVKNTVRGCYLEWYSKMDNWSSFNASYAATDGQFQLSFYVIDQGILGESGNTDTPDEPENPVDPDAPPAENTGMVSTVEELSAGTYYMAGYLEYYESSGNPYDFSAAPYHVWSGTANGKLDTTGYAFDNGVLSTTATSNLGAAIVLEAVSGKANTYYIKCGDKYLYVSEYANHKLTLGDTKAEWVASNNENGGITMTTTTSGGDIYMGTAGATKQMIRNYVKIANLKYGLVFFAAN